MAPPWKALIASRLCLDTFTYTLIAISTRVICEQLSLNTFLASLWSAFCARLVRLAFHPGKMHS
jgi:hypothetical protein